MYGNVIGLAPHLLGFQNIPQKGLARLHFLNRQLNLETASSGVSHNLPTLLIRLLGKQT